MIPCEHCQTLVDETDRRALTTHYWTHRIGGPHLIMKHFHGGVAPVCACGCGEKTAYNKLTMRFGAYLEVHKPHNKRQELVEVGVVPCVKCGTELALNDRVGLTEHYWEKHRIGGPWVILRYFHGGKAPVCSCGCGFLTRWDRNRKRFGDYREGHQSRTHCDALVAGVVVQAPKVEVRVIKKGVPRPVYPVVYSITNKVNGKRYVGLDSYWPNRRSHHLRFLRKGEHANPYLQNSFTKYGEEAFIFEILERLPVDQYFELGQREQYWINTLDSYVNGYNMSRGGEGSNTHLTERERRAALDELGKRKRPRTKPYKARPVVLPLAEQRINQTQGESFDEQGRPRCVACSKAFENRSELVQHFSWYHSIHAPVTHLHFYCRGVRPVCACGCGAITGYHPHKKRFSVFLTGHCNRGKVRNVKGHNGKRAT